MCLTIRNAFGPIKSLITETLTLSVVTPGFVPSMYARILSTQSSMMSRRRIHQVSLPLLHRCRSAGLLLAGMNMFSSCAVNTFAV